MSNYGTGYSIRGRTLIFQLFNFITYSVFEIPVNFSIALHTVPTSTRLNFCICTFFSSYLMKPLLRIGMGIFTDFQLDSGYFYSLYIQLYLIIS